MELVFDAAAEPIGFVPASLFALLPLGFWAYERFLRKRAATMVLPIISAVLFLGINGIQVWDLQRVQAMLRSGEGVHVTRGPITESWHIVSSRRDWTRSSLAYKRTVSEGFDVGNERFSWNVGDSFSPATFSNAGAKSLTFAKDAQVEVTWFNDPAADNTRRIIRLKLGPPMAAAIASGDPDSHRQLFLTAFASAFAARDTLRLNALTRFPFLFGGEALQESQADTLWTGLATAAMQACLNTTKPVLEADGAMMVFCSQTIFVFRKGEDGAWRFVEIGIDD